MDPPFVVACVSLSKALTMGGGEVMCWILLVLADINMVVE